MRLISFKKLNLLLISGLLLYCLTSYAQTTPSTSGAGSLDPNSDSSSFVPDADPLDPLPVKSENLKTEEEGVVEDIKQVLNQPLPPPVPPPILQPVPPPVIQDTSADSTKPNTNETPENKAADQDTANNEIKKVVKEVNKRKAAKNKVATKKLTSKKRNRSRSLDNSADLAMEMRFHQIYKRIHSQPTSIEGWLSVVGPQSAQIYTIQKGDNLYNISGALFGDSQYWPKIWSINELDILNPHFINPGKPIYFYPGTFEAPPTLALEKSVDSIIAQGELEKKIENNSDKKSEKAEPEVAFQMNKIYDDTDEDAIDLDRKAVQSEEKSIDGRPYDKQNTEWRRNIVRKTNPNADADPSQIPSSFPTYYSYKYFEPSKTDFTFDLRKAELPPIDIPPNPYIITSSVIETDYTIPSSHTGTIQCKDNHFVPKIEKKNQAAQPGRYFVLDKLKLTTTSLKTTQIYRWIATAEISADNSLRILKCRQLVTTDSMLVSQEKMNLIADPVESVSNGIQIIEGLDFVNQSFVGENQFVLISAGSDLVQPEQSYNIYSNNAGNSVGRVRILKKKGSFAIGYVTEATEVIEINDRLVTQ